MRILVIDDDKVFIEPLLWDLVEEGYEVTHCKSVDEVLDSQRKLKVSVPDLILLDIMMPRGEMYSKRESELIQVYLQKHGQMPPGDGAGGGDDMDDLF